MPRASFFLCPLLICVAGSVCAEEVRTAPVYPKWANRGVISITAATDDFPYSFLNDKGELAGFSLEVFEAIGRRAGFRCRLVPGTRVELRNRFEAVDNEEIDVFHVQSRYQTEENFSENFTVPYLFQRRRIWVNRHDKTVKTMQDLNGRDVATGTPGYWVDQILEQHGVKGVPHRLPSLEDSLAGVDRGEYAATMASVLSARALIRKNGWKNIVPLEAVLISEANHQCFVTRLGDGELLARLNDGILQMHRDGELGRIYGKWFGEFDQPEISTTQLTLAAVTVMLVVGGLIVVFVVRERSNRRELARQAEVLAEREAVQTLVHNRIPLAMAIIEKVADGHRLLSINRAAETFFLIPSAAAPQKKLRGLRGMAGWIELLEDVLKRWPPPGATLQEEHMLGRSKIRLAITLMPLPAERGGVPRACLLAKDITEHREAELQDARARELRIVGEVAVGIARELTQAVVPIMLNAALLKGDFAGDRRIEGDAGAIMTAAEHATALISKLLAISRTAERKPAACRLRNAVAEDVRMVSHTSDRRILWETSVPDDLPVLWMEPGHLDLILFQLLLRARDASAHKLAALTDADTHWLPVVQVGAVALSPDGFRKFSDQDNPPEGWQMLTVRDNGVWRHSGGNAENPDPLIPDTLFKLVDEIGGGIEIETGSDEETVFKVYLPVLAVPEDAGAARADPMPASGAVRQGALA